MTTPHQRRLSELEAVRVIVAELDRLVATTTVGTVPRDQVANLFQEQAAGLPAGSPLKQQLERLSAMLRQGPARTRVEALRRIARKLRLRAEDVGYAVEARDAQLRRRG